MCGSLLSARRMSARGIVQGLGVHGASARGSKPDGQGPFDFTAFGGPAEVTSYMFTPNANVNRLGYKAYNDLAVETFADSLADFATSRLGGT